MTNKWMTSGASRLKANLSRSFGARKNKNSASSAAAASHPSYGRGVNSVVSLSSSLARKKNKGRKRGGLSATPSKLQAFERANRQATAKSTAVTTDKAMAAAVAGDGDRSSKSEGRPPSHFFSKNYDCSDNQLFLSHQQRNRRGQSSLEPAYNIPTRHAEEELLRLRRRGGGDQLQLGAASTCRRAFPPMAMAMGVAHLRPPIMLGIGSFKEDDTEDTLQTESVGRIIATQEEHARRCIELEQLRHLEYIQAVNQSRIEEEMMMAEQQYHHLQLYHTTSHEVGQRSGRIDDEIKIRQARLMQLRSMPTSELLSRLHEKMHHSQSQREHVERYCSIGTISSGAASATAASEQAAAPIVQDRLRQGRSVSTTTKAPPPPPLPSLRYWNNGVEVDVRGAPLAASAPVSRFNSTNSATSATSRSAAYDNNIVSRFSTLVISCVPEVKSAVSNLLSDVEMVRGFPSDPLIVRSAFPRFVEASWIELKSLGERTKDKELNKRVRNCIAAIEPYKTMAELDAPSDYSKIRAIVEEGMGSAMDMLSNDPSERRANQQKKRKGSDLSNSKNAKRGKSSLSKPDAMIVFEMYKKHTSNVAEDDNVNEESSKKVISSNHGTSYVKKMEGKKTTARVSNSSHSDTTTELKEGTSQRTLEKSHSSDPSDDNSTYAQAKPTAIIEQGPHSGLLQQIFGNGQNGSVPGNTCFSAKVNNTDEVATTSKQVVSSDQKKAGDKAVHSGHLSVANVLLGLGDKH